MLLPSSNFLMSPHCRRDNNYEVVDQLQSSPSQCNLKSHACRIFFLFTYIAWIILRYLCHQSFQFWNNTSPKLEKCLLMCVAQSNYFSVFLYQGNFLVIHTLVPFPLSGCSKRSHLKGHQDETLGKSLLHFPPCNCANVKRLTWVKMSTKARGALPSEPALNKNTTLILKDSVSLKVLFSLQDKALIAWMHKTSYDGYQILCWENTVPSTPFVCSVKVLST